MIIHQFIDIGNNVPLIFDEETERILFTKFKTNYHKIIIHSGYLARENTFSRVEYFHRFIMIMKLKKKGLHLQVHHKNGNKLDNRKENLELIEKDRHHKHHKTKAYNQAYSTWCEKVYGEFSDIEEDHYEEFDEWLEKKQEEENE